MARLLIRPCFTSKAAAAQRSGTLRSPVARNLMISPPSSPMNSRRILLSWPLPINRATLPDDEPRIWAPELPRPARSIRPLSLPRLPLVRSTRGNNWLSCSMRASSLACTATGLLLASIRIKPASRPPARPISSGSSCSTPSLRLMRVSMRSRGKALAFVICTALYRTSAFMVLSRSKSRVAVGSTFPAGCTCLAADEDPPLVTVLVVVRDAPVGTPISGAMSLKSSDFDCRLPDSRDNAPEVS